MNKILLLTISFLSCTVLLTAQKLIGNKNVIAQTRSLKSFNMIEIHDNIDIYFINNDSKEVKVETDENLQDAINTSVNNGLLTINIEGKIKRKKSLKIFISTSNDIHTITANNNANLHATNTISLDSLTLNINDNVDADLNLKTRYFNLKAAKNSDIKLSVQSDSIAKITMEGSAELKALISSPHTNYFGKQNSKAIINGSTEQLLLNTVDDATFVGHEFKTKNANMSTSGSSDVYIRATETLNISSSESSEVYIFSKPEITIEKFSDKAILRKKEKMGLLRI